MNIWERKEVVAGLENLSKKYQSFKYELAPGSKPIIKVGRQTFDTPAEALEHIKSLNLTELDTFDATAARFKLPGVGGQQYYRLNELASAVADEGVTFERMGFQNKGAEAVEKVQQLYGGKGIVYSRGDTTTALIFYNKAGNQLNREQTLELLKRKGFYFDDSAKTLKRLSALTNQYPYGATGININSAFFDPLQTGRGANMMAEYGYDYVQTSKGLSYRVAKGRAVGGGMDEFLREMPYGELDDLRDPVRRRAVLKNADRVNELKSAYKSLGRGALDISNASQVLEAGRFMAAQEAVKVATDGSVYGSARLAGKVQVFMNAEIARIDKSLKEALRANPGFANTAEYADAVNNIEKMKRHISELKSVEISGGQFNVRIMNYDITMADRALGGQGVLDDQMKRFASQTLGYSTSEVNNAKFLGQIKGNISFVGEGTRKNAKDLKNWRKVVSEQLANYKGQVSIGADGNLYGIDGKVINIGDLDIVAPFQSVTREFGTVAKNTASRMTGNISLQILGEGQRVFIDPQMLFADPEIFDPRAIGKFNFDIAKSLSRDLQSDQILKDYQSYVMDKSIGIRKRPTGLLGSIIDAAEGPMDSQQRRSAQRMIEMLDSGIGPSQNPLFAQQFLSEFNQWTGGKPGIPRLLMPLSMQAEVSNTLGASSSVRKGSISFQKGKGFLLNDTDYYKYYKAFGGFDLDDMLRSFMTWDRASDSLHAIVKRSPGARGEVAVLQVDLNDDLVDEILEGASKINGAAKSYVETSKLLESKIKVKALLQEAMNPGFTTSGNVLSDNLSAMIEAGVTTEDFKMLGASDDFAVMITKAAREGRPLTQLEIDSLLGLNINESLDELITQRSTLRGSKEAGGRLRVLEDLMGEYGRSYDSSAGDELSEIVKKLQKRSLSISNESLGGIAKYTTLEEEAAKRGVDLTSGGFKSFGGYLDESLEAAKRTEGVLGLGANLRMAIDSMIATAELEDRLPSIQAKLSAKGLGPIGVFMQEDMIDALTKEGGKYAKLISDVTNDNVKYLADMLYAAEGDLTIDPILRSNEFGKGKLNNQWVEIINERLMELSKDSGTIKTIDDYMVESDYGRIFREAKTYIDMIGQEKARASSSLGMAKSIQNELFSLQAEKEADELYNIVKGTYKSFDPFGDTGDFIRFAEYMGETGLEEAEGVQAAKIVQARKEFLRELMDRGYVREAGDAFEMTSEGRNVVGALMQRRGAVSMPEVEGIRKSLFSTSDPLSDIFHSTTLWFEGMRGNEQAAAKATNILGPDLADYINNEVKGTKRSERISGAIAREMEGAPPGSSGYIRARAARNVTDDVIDSVAGSTRMLKMNLENLKPLMDNKLFKGGLIGGAGLVAFSALYQKFKDRTPEDVQGPPLLPGGSFYDRDPNRYSSEILANSRQSSPNGVTYRVRAIGNFNPEELSSSIEGLTGASVNSTTYQSRGFSRQRTPIEEAINNSFR